MFDETDGNDLVYTKAIESLEEIEKHAAEILCHSQKEARNALVQSHEETAEILEQSHEKHFAFSIALQEKNQTALNKFKNSL